MDKYSCFKLELIDGARLTGQYDFPMLQRTNYEPINVCQFKASEMKTRDKWGHFFIDDYKFNALWTNTNRYMEQLKAYKGIITPDYSMYMNIPKAQQIWNCYRNRVLAYYIQKNGIKIIPSVSWTDRDSYDWCFDGVEEGSTVAISTNGCLSKSARPIFLEGFLAMIDKISPDKIIVVGKEIDVSVPVEMIYFETDMQKYNKVV